MDDFVDLNDYKKDKEEEITGFTANPNMLFWDQIKTDTEGNKTVEKCYGSFGFLQTENVTELAMVFVVTIEDQEENSIAIPRQVLETALIEGWIPKRGNGRDKS